MPRQVTTIHSSSHYECREQDTAAAFVFATTFTRFLLTAGAANGSRACATAAILGYFLAFGLMGLWHGIEPYYILYGLYMATLLSGFHIFSSWTKVHQLWRKGPVWSALAFLLRSMPSALDCRSFPRTWRRKHNDHPKSSRLWRMFLSSPD